MLATLHLEYLGSSLVYSLLGVLVFCICFIAVDKLTPYDLWKELIEGRNQALATVVAACALGVAIIIASAIH